MGFDNECILNIQSLPGEYFCPVCRLLVYPNEALQSQCTHLYCKPCLTYVVSTSHACPYDGYLVTEADSKPLIESDKTLAETIGKVAVFCLYHRSGCTWQGKLSECITHCESCSFGDSPVVCNRCGTQIVHRQVQEHAQNCPGVQPLAQQTVGSQAATTATGATAAATSEQNQAITQAGAATSQAQAVQTATAPPSGQGQSQGNANSQPQAAVQAVPTPEQMYQQQQQQQQYQQYYQQYPGYDPYQQQYQQYPGSYQQQAYQQYQQQHPPQAIPGQQPQMYVQPQAQPQVPVRPQAQPQPQVQVQVQSQPQPHPQPQPQPQPPTHVYPQAPVGGQPQVQAQVNPPAQLQPSHPHPQMQQQTYPQQPQIYAQAQPHPQQLQAQPHPQQLQAQSHLQQRPQVPQHQQLNSQPTQSQQQTLPYHQPQGVAQTHQSQGQHYAHAPMQPQTARPHAQPQTQPQHPVSHTVSGHQAYPQPQPSQQLVPGASQVHPVHMSHSQQGAPHQLPQHTVQVQAQFPQQQLGQMRPPVSHVPVQQQQQAMLPQGQQPNVPSSQHVHPHAQPNQPMHQYPVVHPPHQQSAAPQQAHGNSLYPQGFPVQAHGPSQITTQHPQFIQQQVVQPQLRPQVHPPALPPTSHAQQQLQQTVPISHGLQTHQSQNYAGRPLLPNHGLSHQQFQSSTAGPAGPASSNMTPSSGPQTYPPRSNIQEQSSGDQQSGYMQQAVPPQSGNENASFPTSAAPQIKAGPQPEAASQVTAAEEAVEQKQESEMKSIDGSKKSEGEKSSHLNLNAKESSESSQTLEKDPISSSQKGSEDLVVKNMVKEEVTAHSDGVLPDTSVQKQDDSHIAQKSDENSQLEDKEVHVDVQKSLLSQEADILNRKDIKVPNDPINSQEKATSEGTIHVNTRNNRVSASDRQQLPMNFGPSHMHDQIHQRSQIPDNLPQQNIHPHQMQLPGPPSTHMRPQGNPIHGNVLPHGHSSSAPVHFQHPNANQHLGSSHPEAFGPGSSAPLGRGPGAFGLQGHLSMGQVPPHHAGGPRTRGDSAGGPPFGGPPLGSFESQGSSLGRVPPTGQQMPANPMDSEFVANKRTGYFDGRPSNSHMPGSADRPPFGHPPNMQSDHMKVNGGAIRPLSDGLSDPSFPYAVQDRFKHFPEDRFRQLPEINLPGEEHISSFSLESGRRGVNHREFLNDLKHFPRPTHLDSDPVSKSQSYMSSSRPLDMVPHGLTGDARFKHDGSASTAASRLLPPYQGGSARPVDPRDDHVGLRPVFNRPAPEFDRLHMDGFPSLRSPGRQFSEIPSSRFGRIEDNDGREERAFGERSKPFNLHSDNNPFLERRFPILPSHLRGEPDVPGNLRLGERLHMRGGDLVGSDILPSHLRSSGPMGPHNLHMGEPGGYGTYPNSLRLADVGGPGNLPMHLRIGESIGGNLPNHSRLGFSSSMPVHGFPSDAGFSNAGEVDTLDGSRKRKHGSMGWCRICKVDCETVEGLEMHSQTREHQKIAMDLVLIIKKDNAKKQRISSDDHTSHEGERNNARKINIENLGK